MPSKTSVKGPADVHQKKNGPCYRGTADVQESSNSMPFTTQEGSFLKLGHENITRDFILGGGHVFSDVTGQRRSSAPFPIRLPRARSRPTRGSGASARLPGGGTAAQTPPPSPPPGSGRWRRTGAAGHLGGEELHHAPLHQLLRCRAEPLADDGDEVAAGVAQGPGDGGRNRRRAVSPCRAHA